MQVEIIDPVSGVKPGQFRSCIKMVLEGEQRSAAQVNVIFTSRDRLRRLKKEYFGQDVYTDVITFNLNDPGEDLEGEIYLSPEQIQENAEQYGTLWEEELYRVLIHGCLHLCGHEDDTPQTKAGMTSLENIYLDQLKGLSSS